MNPALINLFARLSEAMRAVGECEVKHLRRTQFRVFDVSEISLLEQKIDGIWQSEGITFELFGDEMMFTPDGDITVCDQTGPEIEVYSIGEAKMLKAVGMFLAWRLKVLEVMSV